MQGNEGRKRVMRGLFWLLPATLLACTEIGGLGTPDRRDFSGTALNVLALDYERMVFERGAAVSGHLAQIQRRTRIATPSGGLLRDRALGPIPTEVKLNVRRLTTAGRNVSVSGDLVLRDLSLGVTLAEFPGFTASGRIPASMRGSRTPGLPFRAIDEEIIAWLSTLQCDTALRRCGIAPPAPAGIDPEDALTEGADLNLAAMVGPRPSGVRKIIAGGIDPDQVIAAAPEPPREVEPTDGVLTPIGETVAALGMLDRSGFWLQTPLVDAEVQGEVQIKGTNDRLAVTLIPKPGPRGGGSQLSLAAMAELGIDMTDLVTLVVYRP